MSGESTLAGDTDGDVVGSSARPQLARGDVVGRYVVLDELGNGAMGIVYAAYDPELDRKVALKLLRERVHTSEARRTRLLREAQALARLSHPNVVTVFDVGTIDGGVWLAMEFVQGRTLTRWLRESPRGWREVLQTMRAAGAGLASAHRAGLVHRDFKPDNVMVADDGLVRVMDFGLARAGAAEQIGSFDDISSTGTRALTLDLTQDGAIVGTPAYMAPEQLAGVPADARSDQYGFCVTLHEALHGRRPHAASIPHELLAEILLERPIPRTTRGVPRWVNRVVGRGLARRPEQRFADMDELLAALARDPRRVRVAMAGVGVVAAMAGALVAVPAWQRNLAMQACAQESRAIDGVWDWTAREHLSATLEATDKPFATYTRDRANVVLDQYAGRWRATAEQLCVAAKVEHTLPEPAHASASECLADRMDAVAAVLEVFSQVEHSQMDRLAPALESLEPVESCADPVAMARAVPLPDDPSAREWIASARRELHTAKALHAAAQYERGAVLVTDVLARAREAGHVPLIAESLLQLGGLHTARGDHAGAVATFEEAFFVGGPSDVHGVMIDAATSLVWILGNRLDRPEEAALWARLAEMLLEQHGETGTVREAKLLVRRASLLLDRGELDEAYELGTRALAITEAQLGPDHPQIGDAGRLLGSVHLRRGELDEAKAVTARALSAEEAAFGPLHPALGSTLNNLANVYAAKRDFVEARKMHERALALRITAYGPDSVQAASSYLNIGATLTEMGDFDGALARFEEARRIHEAHPEVNRILLARCISNIANLHLVQGDFHSALANADEAIALQRETGAADHPDASAPYNIRGWALSRLDRFAEAQAAFEHALQLIEAKSPDPEEPIQPLLGIAQAKLARGLSPEPELERAAAMVGKDASAESHALLGSVRALELQQRGETNEAIAFARAAVADYGRAGSVFATDRARLEAWIATLVQR